MELGNKGCTETDCKNCRANQKYVYKLMSIKNGKIMC